MFSIIKNIFLRICEALLFGVFIEVSFSLLMLLVFKVDMLDHLSSVYDSNNNYLANNILIGHGVWSYIQQYTLDIGRTALSTYNIIEWLRIILEVILISLVVVLQKLLIAIISIPIYLICLAVGVFDGWIARELRRYRAGTESTRRESYANWALRFERLLFIGYVSIPMYIPAMYWFLSFGIVIAMLERMKNEFRQKYL